MSRLDTVLDRSLVGAVREREDARFLAERAKSLDLLERGRRSMPHGVPMAWMNDLYDHPPVFIDHGEGAHFTDVDGHRYLDMNLADTSMFCGYAPEPVVEAVERQTRRGSQFLLPTEDALWVAEELGRRWPLPAWQFTLSASLANAEAIRLARAATGRDFVLVFDGKYLGHTDEELVALDADGRPCPQFLGLTEGAARKTRIVQFNDVGALEEALADGEVACVVTEPAITDLGVIQPEPGFHEALRHATRETGTLLVLDETHTLICGWGGLVGEWALRPDIVTLGKSIAGGIPIGAYGMTSELAEVLDRPATRSEAEPGTVDQVATGGTFFANALSLAASRAALEHLLTKKAYERARALGAQLADGIEGVFRAAELPWSVQRLFTRSGYTFADSLPANAVEARAALDPELGALIRIHLANRGIWEAGWWAGPAVSIAAVEADIREYVQTLAELTEELTGSR